MIIHRNISERRCWLALLLASGLALAGCDAWNHAWQLNEPNDLGEQIMQKHYLNGDMTAQQYNSEVKVFNPQAQTPGATDPNTADGLDAAFPPSTSKATIVQPKLDTP